MKMPPGSNPRSATSSVLLVTGTCDNLSKESADRNLDLALD